MQVSIVVRGKAGRKQTVEREERCAAQTLQPSNTRGLQQQVQFA